MEKRVPITVAHGDGIGPEIMPATLRILEAAEAPLELEEIVIGKAVYEAGHLSGIAPEAWESLRRTKVFFKAPITTPQGGGYKSLNVTIRTSLGLFANVRPCISYYPFIQTKHPKMDVVIVRENEEDLYAGIEHRQTDDVYQCLKLISRPGSERIMRYAFEYARQHGRKKVSCFSKDNIMKLTDGLFHKVFDEVSSEYPEIETDHWIIDIGAARLADTPEIFDVIVTTNLYGDVISDIAAQVAGSVGLAGSGNIGERCAMFEAIHGSAPTIAGQGIANPSGLILASVMMLNHVGLGDSASKVHNAWMKTLEDGIHTGDVASDNYSKKVVGTDEFADAVIANMGKVPETLPKVNYGSEIQSCVIMRKDTGRQPEEKSLVGVDIFLHERKPDVEELARNAKAAIEGTEFELEMITNRGVQVWPEGMPETYCADHWRCRFRSKGGATVKREAIVDLLGKLVAAGFDCIKTENLYLFDGKPGFSGKQSN